MEGQTTLMDCLQLREELERNLSHLTLAEGTPGHRQCVQVLLTLPGELSRHVALTRAWAYISLVIEGWLRDRTFEDPEKLAGGVRISTCMTVVWLDTVEKKLVYRIFIVA